MVPINSDPTRTRSSESTEAEDQRDNEAKPAKTNSGVQGEGNYEATRQFNEAEQKFVVSGKVDAAARAAAPTSEAEQQEMIAAEEKGKRRAKDDNPTLTKAWPDPVTTRKA